MKRLLPGLAALAAISAVVLTAGTSTAATNGGNAVRACTSGQVRCLALISADPAGKVIAAAKPAALPSGLSPAQLHRAYNLPTKAAGAATVAVVGAFDSASAYADLTAYSKTFGLPVLPECTSRVTTACFQKVNLGAKTGSAAKHGWDVETALDVQAIHATCQNCKLVLVEAKSDSLSAFIAAEREAGGRAAIVSNSWGASPVAGGFGGSADAAFTQPRHAIVVSSGDEGYAPSYPAVLNSVVSVGGTNLAIDADGTYRSERVWSGTGSGCGTGSSGGINPVLAQPFQKSALGFTSAGCPAGIRGSNDVAAVADPSTGLAVYVKSRGWMRVGGTSLAAPVIAGIYGLAGNATSTQWPAAYAYSHLGTGAFHDVATGTNTSKRGCDGFPARCTARPGYDLPTGVGTPNGISGF